MLREITAILTLVFVAPSVAVSDPSSDELSASRAIVSNGCTDEFLTCLGIGREQCASAISIAVASCPSPDVLPKDPSSDDVKTADAVLKIWFECVSGHWAQNLGVNLDLYPQCKMDFDAVEKGGGDAGI